MEMDLVISIRNDFEQWSGGFPPDSIDQIYIYAIFGSSSEIPDDEVVESLMSWLCELE